MKTRHSFLHYHQIQSKNKAEFSCIAGSFSLHSLWETGIPIIAAPWSPFLGEPLVLPLEASSLSIFLVGNSDLGDKLNQ